MAKRSEATDLKELLEETRILLPGSEILVAFLTSLPFTDRFGALTQLQKTVYLTTFLSALAAFVCFVMPAAYHRLARPILDRRRFKVFANRFLVVGLVPLSLALTLVAFLATSLAFTTFTATIVSCASGLLIALLWWVVPMTRMHRECDLPPKERALAEGELVEEATALDSRGPDPAPARRAPRSIAPKRLREV
jgi:hypothetical protein